MSKNVPKNGQNIAISVKFHETVKLIVHFDHLIFISSTRTFKGKMNEKLYMEFHIK